MLDAARRCRVCSASFRWVYFAYREVARGRRYAERRYPLSCPNTATHRVRALPPASLVAVDRCPPTIDDRRCKV